MFGLRRLNQALKCLAQCMEELANHALKSDRSLLLPYAMADGKIASLPVIMNRVRVSLGFSLLGLV